MRLLEKYKTVEEIGIHERNRYSRQAQLYCHQRYGCAKIRDYKLFWLNMSYIYTLMTETNPQRFL